MKTGNDEKRHAELVSRLAELRRTVFDLLLEEKEPAPETVKEIEELRRALGWMIESGE